MFIDFSNLVADAMQEDNIAGNYAWIGVCLAKNFSVAYPSPADIVDGEITGSPVTSLGTKKFAKIEVPQNTVKFTSTETGTAGFNNVNHMIEFKLAGMKKEVQAEFKKYKNALVVFLVPGSDGLIYLVGSSQNGILMKANGDSGADGSGQRGFTMTGESSGHGNAPYPLSPETAALIPWL